VNFDDGYVAEVTDVGDPYLLDTHAVLLWTADGCIGAMSVKGSV
jgi:hypothetical protein